MKQIGGISLSPAGRPSVQIDSLPEPDVLHVPLSTRRFTFSERCVRDGETVPEGAILARDPASHSLPLLAPRGGVVRLAPDSEHITLEGLAPAGSSRPEDPGVGVERLVRLGAWEFFSEARTGGLPDPSVPPGAVVVSAVALEPFTCRGDALLRDAFDGFIRGLEGIQSLLEYQPIHLVIPDVSSDLATRVNDAVRGLAWLKISTVRRVYPAGNGTLAARRLGLTRGTQRPVWCLDAAGVLAVSRALHDGVACSERVLSVAGPAIADPKHVRVCPGYPLERIPGIGSRSDTVRVINGGIFTGTTVPAGQRGVDNECRGLTVLSEEVNREVLGFLRPGGDRRSYSRCFLSTLSPPLAERLTTALRGEKRACVACGLCERVCPAGIMPNLIHKFLYRDLLEEAETLRIDLCIGCGLCSYVCPSKIELTAELTQALDTIRREMVAAEGTTHEAAS